MTSEVALQRDITPAVGVHDLVMRYLDAAGVACNRLASVDDAESLHDFRVALRRLHTLLDAYHEYYPAGPGRKLIRRVRRLARRTNAARDREVLLAWLEAQAEALSERELPAYKWWRKRLRRKLRTTHRALHRTLVPRFERLAGDLREHLPDLRSAAGTFSADGNTFARATSERLAFFSDALQAQIAAVHVADDDVEAHQVRITLKRLRYLLEANAQQLDGAEALIDRLKALQDLLGDLHDNHVIAGRIIRAASRAAAGQAEKILRLETEDPIDTLAVQRLRRNDLQSGMSALARRAQSQRREWFEQVQRQLLEDRGRDLLDSLHRLSGRLSA
jgi:CHAD domain-containing protein